MKLRTLAVAALLGTVSLNSQAVSIIATDTFNGHTYQLLSSDTWTNSEAYAETLGHDLITVNDLAEQTWLTNTAFGGFGLQNSYWLGYYRNPNNPAEFIWDDGSNSTFTYWNPGEPNNSNSYNADDENYVHTYHSCCSGKWNDLANVDPYEGPKFAVIEFGADPVPEPATALLLGLGIAGAAARRRRT